MNASRAWVSVCVAVGLLAGTASALNMETVSVGDPGNTGELSGASVPGGYGPDAILGAVGYTYNVGKHEVTAGQYTEFLNAMAQTDTYGLYNPNMWLDNYGCKIERTGSSGSYTYSVAADWMNRPVNFVSWGDSARVANWMHNGQPTGTRSLATTEDGAYFLNGAITDAELLAVNREADWKWAITSEDEWYKAAYYNPGTSSYYDYPTSSDTAPGYINDSGDFSRTGDGSFNEGGTDPGNYATYDGDTGTDGIGPPYYLTEAGEHENSDSPYGTFDQGGNLYEWNEAVLHGLSRGLRGGSFNGYTYHRLLAANRYFNDQIFPTYEGYSVGFRVVQIPESATIVMLALGGLALLRRRHI